MCLSRLTPFQPSTAHLEAYSHFACHFYCMWHVVKFTADYRLGALHMLQPCHEICANKFDCKKKATNRVEYRKNIRKGRD